MTDKSQNESKSEENMVSKVYQSAGNALSAFLGNFYFKIGMLIGGAPCITIAVSFLCVLMLGLGIMNLQEETRSERLWVPTDSQAQEDKKFVDEHFDSNLRLQDVAMTINRKEAEARNLGTSVLQPEVLDELLILHYELINVTTSLDGMLLTYEGLCVRSGISCVNLNLLELFRYDPTRWSTREMILETVNSNDTRTVNGNVMDPKVVLGGIVYSEDGSIEDANAIQLIYFLRNNEVKQSDDSYADKNAEAWEAEWLTTLENLDKDGGDSRLRLLDRVWFSTRSFSDEFGGAISSDIAMLQVAIFCNLLYATVMLSRWSRGCLGFRGMVVVGGLVSVGLSVVAAYGFCSAIGIMFTPLMGVMPFLLLGIGVDDMFVLVNSVDAVDENMPNRERLAVAMSHAGPSITLTSLTDFFAFLIGSNTSLPALSAFCIYCSFGILFDFLLQITFFAAILVIDLRVKTDKRADCAWCCTREPVYGVTCCGCKKEEDLLKKFIEKRIANPLRDIKYKAVLLLVFAIITAFGIYGCYEIQVQADVNDFIPAGSYLQDFFEVVDENFVDVGAKCEIYLTEGVDYTHPDVWSQLEELYSAFKATQYVASDTVDSWFHEFYTQRSFTTESFYRELDLFLETDGIQYTADIVRTNVSVPESAQGRILTSRFTGNHLRLQKSQDQVKAMDTLRRTVRESSLSSMAFAYGDQYLQFEQYKEIENEAVQNLGLCLCAVAVVVIVLVVNPLCSLLVIISVGLVVMDVVGFMAHWGLNIDSVTVIMLVLALGLSVDYSAHLGHSFMHLHGSNDDRMVAAMSGMGVAVFNGAMSTFIAVSVLAGSQSYVFITFFKQLFLCTTLGVAHGLLLLPVMLSLVGPAPYEENKLDIDISQTMQSDPKAANGSP